jgi:hypothetical protein
VRLFVIPWFMFINTYGCIALANQISCEWLDGSDLPRWVALTILVVTNFMAGKSLKKNRVAQ